MLSRKEAANNNVYQIDRVSEDLNRVFLVGKTFRHCCGHNVA